MPGLGDDDDDVGESVVMVMLLLSENESLKEKYKKKWRKKIENKSEKYTWGILLISSHIFLFAGLRNDDTNIHLFPLSRPLPFLIALPPIECTPEHVEVG